MGGMGLSAQLCPWSRWLKSCGLEAPLPLPAATRDPAGLMLFTGLVSWGYLLASRDPGLKGPHALED